MNFLKSLKHFGMVMLESIAEARKARADAIVKGIGR